MSASSAARAPAAPPIRPGYDRPMVTFEEARKIVAEEIGEVWPQDYGTFVVLPYGWEDDTYWRVQAGAREYLIDGDDDFAPLDGSVHLVDKDTGELTELLFLGNSDQIRAMRPVGVHPAEH